MACFPRRRPGANASSISLVCSVSDAPSVSVGGEIRVKITGASSPIDITWLQDDRAALLNLSVDRCLARDVPVGTYNIRVRDAKCDEAECTVSVSLITLPAVVGYKVTHATGDSARDGHLQVMTRGLNRHHQQFLWSNGIITTTPELHDVEPGTYVAVPIGDRADQKGFVFIHECAPAVIHPSRKIDALFF